MIKMELFDQSAGEKPFVRVDINDGQEVRVYQDTKFYVEVSDKGNLIMPRRGA